jgi:DHA1 family bicyclomycin/chloramphenicol resistance-like MFS transporter
MTLSGLYFAFGFGQMLMGPLSDRFGRRPVLIGGLLMYLAATLASIGAPSIELLIALRVLQGLGMAAGTVCARAMVRDLYEPQQGAAMLARGLSGLGVIALVGPLLGGVLASAGGWRAAMAACAVFCAVTLTLIARRLPETRSQATAQAFAWRQMASTWWRIAQHPVFVAWCLLSSFTFCGLFTFLAASSFVYIDVLGTSRLAYGGLLMTASGSYLVGTWICRRWLPRRGVVGTVGIGAAFTLTGGIGLAALALGGVHGVWAICVPQMLFMFGHGIHQPVGQAGVAGPFPKHAGAASALAGFVLSAMSVGVGLWLGFALDGTVYPMTLTIAFFAVLTAAVAWGLVPRLGLGAPLKAGGR